MNVNTALIGQGEASLHQLQQSLALLSGVKVTRVLPHYPAQTDMLRFLRACDPDLLFISSEVPAQMEASIALATQTLPNLQIALWDAGGDPHTLKRAMQLGVRECLTVPFAPDEVRGVVERSMTRRGNQRTADTPTNCLYSFLPARPGVGASILAMQTALALPADTSHRGLLLDADLDAGIVQFLFKMQNPYSFIEAMERVEQLDEDLWPQLVSDHGNLDIMQAGDGGDDYRPDLARLQYFVGFARRQYSAILVDLPGGMNRLSVELMQQSKMVFLVTTPELASLHMARKRLRQLQDLQLGQPVRLIVNRVENKGGISMDEIASVIGIPVHATFSNDYPGVQKAILSGSRIPNTFPLGRQIATFAESLWKDPISVPPPRKRRFLEVFALPR
jgi:pilus assembly protein CpaE